MSRALLDHVAASSVKKIPDLKAGATVRVYQKIKEGGKERVQMFQGLVIRVSAGAKLDKTFTVRKVVEGVEKIFPVYTPTIEKIEIVKQGKVRRAKLYYMRDLQGKSTRLRETELAQAVMDEEESVAAPAEEPMEETPVAENESEAPVEPEATEDSTAEDQK